MARRLTALKRTSNGANITPAVLLTSNFYQPSLIDNFLFQEVSDGESKSYTLTSDIYMLFNQKRLDKLTSQALIQHFESMSQKDSSLASLRSKMTDDQLVRFVKSRYIQSPSELLAWSNYLVSLYAEDYAKFQELTQSKQSAPEQSEQIITTHPE